MRSDAKVERDFLERRQAKGEEYFIELRLYSTFRIHTVLLWTLTKEKIGKRHLGAEVEAGNSFTDLQLHYAISIFFVYFGWFMERKHRRDDLEQEENKRSQGV